ncbi:hypothetical protein BJD46_gp44 [Mycobacterium phage Bactobuster]|uniref:Uncharacterized protein n=1 Tax=Mycobacterium phage Bactobuster TaxID=1784956 RepID=A0A127KQ14_9CAUD|nr:hypothetical protein BJD46_gp44 [Mycobacterium phage Bactobuster]AMO44012.1 hypothetical protein SEA_BACTOBUSTER_44 [Mycobacterium phage Bactobuster]
MNIDRVERYRIPIETSFEGVRRELGIPPGGTTVAELIVALGKLPAEARVQTDFNGNGLIAMHYKPDIET